VQLGKFITNDHDNAIIMCVTNHQKHLLLEDTDDVVASKQCVASY
jgi:hypothetical protein